MEQLRIRLLNTGVVREATIDLADLTVIMGYNGSGKSTIATVVYAAVKSASAFRRRVFRSHIRRNYVLGADLNVAINELEAKFLEIASAYRKSSEGGISSSLYREVIHILATSMLKEYCDAFAAEIAAGFGSSFDGLAARNKSGKRLPMRISVSSENPTWTATVWLKGKEIHSQVECRERFDKNFPIPPHEIARLFSRAEDKDRKERLQAVVSILTDDLREQLFRGMPRGTHFLPAARAGLLQSHRLVAATMVQQSPLIGLGGDIALPSLSGVVADFVSEILLGRKLAKGHFMSLATRLESGILGGKVERVQVKSEYPEIEFSDLTGKYPLHRTSSMVSELATLVLLLKSHVSPGELLIVEEPESHLHPRAQAQLAKILFAASRSGLSVMLTTHSDYFVSELNIALLEELSAGLKQYSTLAYWAERGDDGGGRLMCLEIDDSDGISQGSFVEVATEQYDQQFELQEAALRRSEQGTA
jgi:predicted ATPase